MKSIVGWYEIKMSQVPLIYTTGVRKRFPPIKAIATKIYCIIKVFCAGLNNKTDEGRGLEDKDF